jgi:hypothetical protein
MSSDQFLDEVEEDLKRERQQELWNKYGRWVIAAVMVVIVGVAASVGWRHYTANRTAKAALAYAAAVAMPAGKSEDSLKALKTLAEDGPSGFAELARLQEAAQLSRQGNDPAAAAVYDAMSRDSDVAEPFRNVATLLYVLSTLDKGDAAALEARLAPLATATGPWRYSAQELTALLARKRGDEAKAREIFKRLADDTSTPPGVRARAAEFLVVSGK